MNLGLNPRVRGGSDRWLSATAGPVLRDATFDPAYTAWVEQYRNLMSSPRGLNGSNPGNYGTGGNGNYTTVYTGGPDGNSFKRMTWTVANSGGAAYLAFSLPPAYATPVIPLGVYTVSAYVRTSVAHNVRLIATGHTDSAGSGWIGSGGTGATAIPAGEWTRLSFVMTVPSNVTHVRVILGDITGENYAIGETFDAACMMITPGMKLLPFFDPGVGWTQTARGRWTGAVHASQPVYETREPAVPEYTAWVEQRRNRAITPQAFIGTSSWGTDWGTGGVGTAVIENGLMRMDWTTGATAGNRRVRAAANTFTRIPIVPNETITVSMDVAGNVQTMLQMDWMNEAAYVTGTFGSATTVSSSTASPTRVSLTGTAPASGVNYLYVFARAVTSDTGAWLAAGDLMVGSGSYLDGDLGDTSTTRHRWLNGANVSPSVYETRSLVEPSLFVRIWAKISGVLSLFRLGAVKSGGTVIPVASAQVKDGGVLKPVV